MDITFFSISILVFGIAILARKPFLDLPIDEDFATFTYIARFQKEGLKWKKDAFLFLYPVWRMILINHLYGNSPENGIQRIRKFLAYQHGITSVLVVLTTFLITENVWASGVAGGFFAFFANVPTLESESINFEQCYLPFLLASIIFYLLSPNFFLYSGLCLGLTIVTKITTAIYLPSFAIIILFSHGFEEAISYCVYSIIPLAIALSIDASLGYFDSQSLQQMKTRMISSLRCAGQTSMKKRIPHDLKLIIHQTLPLWIFGIPSLLFVLNSNPMFWTFFIITSIAMTLFQKGYSRYHYLPWICFLSIATGVGIVEIVSWSFPFNLISLAILVLFLGLTFKRLFSFYFKPKSTASLAQYSKFEQLIYIPYLGKVIYRWLRVKKWQSNRIFIWGNFIQIYHFVNCPAADNFIHTCVGPWTHPILTNFFDSIIGGLIKHKPKVIIQVFHDLDLNFLGKITGLKYQLKKVLLARYPIYELKSATPQEIDPLTWSKKDKLEALDQLTQGNHTTGINSLDVQNGRINKAISECKKMLRLNPYDLEGNKFLAELISESGNINESIQIAKEMAVHSTKTPGINALIAKQYLKLGNLSEAESYVQKEINQHGYNATSHFIQGLIFSANKLNNEAAKHFEKALKENPKNWEIYYHLALTQINMGDTLEGLTILEKIRKEAIHQSFSGLRNQACIQLAQLRSDTIPEYESLRNYYIEDLDNQYLMYSLGSAFERHGKKNEALKIFTELTDKLKPGHFSAAAWFRRARLSPLDEQKSMLENCLKQNSNHQEARRMINSLEVTHAQT